MSVSPNAMTPKRVMPEVGESLDDRPEVRNLIAIYAALSDQTKDQVTAQFAGQGFGAFKPALAEVAVEVLAPITAKMTQFMADPAEIDRILGRGADQAAASGGVGEGEVTIRHEGLLRANRKSCHCTRQSAKRN